MKKVATWIAIVAIFAASPSAYAIWSVSDTGTWPESWPKELEPLRKQSRTMVGGLINLEVHQIPFTKRGEFEAAWAHLLRVKSKGAPIILVRGPKDGFFDLKPAGVIVHSPPRGSKRPEKPIVDAQNTKDCWINTTYIELVVDGLVVDLNRIPLPPDTPIIDERFRDDKNTVAPKKLPEPSDRPHNESD